MLIIRNGKAGNSTGAANYFNDGLAKNDYFTEQETVAGHWHGQTKALLGLGDTVEAQEFKNLVAGLDPQTGQKLTARMKKNRVAGAEFTFSCSKSISILYAMTGDERIIEAFRQSVAETTKEVILVLKKEKTVAEVVSDALGVAANTLTIVDYFKHEDKK